MSALPTILRFGDPRLRAVARPVDAQSVAADLSLAADLPRALADFQARFGWGRAIAAPQLGLDMRVLALELGQGVFLAINPVIVWRSPDMAEVLDDCFSLPEITAPVRRHASVSLAYLDERLQPHTLTGLPFAASELVQHEVDHLDGVLFVDRITDPSRIVAREHRPA